VPGVKLFRANGANLRAKVANAKTHYVGTPEASGQLAKGYYLSGDQQGAIAYSVKDGSGRDVGELRGITGDQYAEWISWRDIDTGEMKGTPPREPRTKDGLAIGKAGDNGGSPLFVERIITAPKSLSMLAVLNPRLADALAQAQADAAEELGKFLAQNSYTRIGARGEQRLVKAERVEYVSIRHMASRDGDPHPHLHFQFSTKVWAEGKWRQLDTATTLRQIGDIEAITYATIMAHPAIRKALLEMGASIDPETGEVSGITREDIEHFSKRHVAIKKQIKEFEQEWRAANPGDEPGAHLWKMWDQAAWAKTRPAKESSETPEELDERWKIELAERGISLNEFGWLNNSQHRTPTYDFQLNEQTIANRAVARVAATRSTWSKHDLANAVAKELVASGFSGMSATNPAKTVEKIAKIAAEGCLNVLDPKDHSLATRAAVRSLTSASVIAEEQRLDRLLEITAEYRLNLRSQDSGERYLAGLNAGQQAAARALTSANGLVVVQGAAGAGKTRMLAAVQDYFEKTDGNVVVLAPSAKAANVAGKEIGAESSTVHGLLYAYGFRWNEYGEYRQLRDGEMDPATGKAWPGIADSAPLLNARTRIIVDEAGMLDQATTSALINVAQQWDATLGLVGDTQQIGAIGRGGVLQKAAGLVQPIDLTEVHRFSDVRYAKLTLQLRDRKPAAVKNLLDAKLVTSEPDIATAVNRIGRSIAAKLIDNAANGESLSILAITSSNENAAQVNETVQADLRKAGLVQSTTWVHTTAGADGLRAGIGDKIQTRQNDRRAKVFNRDVWTVTGHRDGGLDVINEDGRRAYLPANYVSKHTTLAYAVTAYGAQGVTVDETVSLVDESTNAPALYVSASRGRNDNRLVVVAEDLDDAAGVLLAALEREPGDTGLTDAIEDARRALIGLIDESELYDQFFAPLEPEPEPVPVLVGAPNEPQQDQGDLVARYKQAAYTAQPNREPVPEPEPVAVVHDQPGKNPDLEIHWTPATDEQDDAYAKKLFGDDYDPAKHSAAAKRGEYVAEPDEPIFETYEQLLNHYLEREFASLQVLNEEQERAWEEVPELDPIEELHQEVEAKLANDLNLIEQQRSREVAEAHREAAEAANELHHLETGIEERQHAGEDAVHMYQAASDAWRLAKQKENAAHLAQSTLDQNVITAKEHFDIENSRRFNKAGKAEAAQRLAEAQLSAATGQAALDEATTALDWYGNVFEKSLADLRQVASGGEPLVEVADFSFLGEETHWQLGDLVKQRDGTIYEVVMAPDNKTFAVARQNDDGTLNPPEREVSTTDRHWARKTNALTEAELLRMAKEPPQTLLEGQATLEETIARLPDKLNEVRDEIAEIEVVARQKAAEGHLGIDAMAQIGAEEFSELVEYAKSAESRAVNLGGDHRTYGGYIGAMIERGLSPEQVRREIDVAELTHAIHKTDGDYMAPDYLGRYLGVPLNKITDKILEPEKYARDYLEKPDATLATGLKTVERAIRESDERYEEVQEEKRAEARRNFVPFHHTPTYGEPSYSGPSYSGLDF
jgi:conjugative relaxase-like TrwC/TraI family protein